MTDPLLPLSQPSSPKSKQEIGDPDKLSAEERGFSFIPIRQAHLNYLVNVYGREHPSLDRVFGRTMVDQNYLPLGMCLIYFPAHDHARAELHAHFGKWLKLYPTFVLEGMRPVAKRARDAGVKELYAIADEAVEGSDTLITYFKGEKTEEYHEYPPVGWVYRLDLYNEKIDSWINRNKKDD